MPRTTGTYRVTRVGGAGNEEVRAFVPAPLPPADPPLALDERLMALHAEAVAAVGKLGVAGAMVPSPPWLITLPLAVDLLGVSKPTAIKAIESLEKTGILRETTGKRRDRVYAYQKYLDVLTGA